jgi:hypothetical protein
LEVSWSDSLNPEGIITQEWKLTERRGWAGMHITNTSGKAK